MGFLLLQGSMQLSGIFGIEMEEIVLTERMIVVDKAVAGSKPLASWS
jgi:hypothetical protein